MANDKKVVEAIFNELFFDNLPRYKGALSKSPDANKDVYARARNAIAKLDQEDKDAVFEFFKIIIADTASVILGTIDGSHFPNDIDGDFKLSYEDEEIQGCLQDYFIAGAEGINTYK
ncbi:hypothetical protein QVN42_15175 [Yersinia nurmii]|uniref:Uncharacterized protein n=1 Tax=Yersinia nurmii TaxID=685706 RepID=A0AAW7K4V5_9GAMM|nr:hypothetical protein [Yersinia nurmii]MDN0088697.1 hypothetical protein [Yersinia nurmii]CNF29200.1 Uncharacterised protein [Yersinia nurmii]